MKKSLILLLCSLVLCYAGKSFAHDQYEEPYSVYKINPDKFEIRFQRLKGSSTRVGEETMHHYSDITLKNGYKYFIVINENREPCIRNLVVKGIRELCVVSALIQCFKVKPALETEKTIYDTELILNKKASLREEEKSIK